MNAVRCAIYTRKSSEEGLDQAFNSLDAQREACAAYVLSQASEGWAASPAMYDDGGLSGGSLERPALQRLLSDIAAGKVDIVLVYKVDRLTRSLMDFAKLVEAFDKANVSFVSITQSFNTTTSMGRLTLNMLLSFAQFEREVTAERIRDKLAASKAKGMWMGGVTPLGYEPDGRTLKIVPEHAAIIRDIYDRYLRLGNVRLLMEQLERDGVRVPVRTHHSGRTAGGDPFCRRRLYNILNSPVYAGDIPHRDKTYPGQHEAIIDREAWRASRERLARNVQGERTGKRGPSPSQLAGKVFDQSGAPLVASHATKGKKRYRYYVSRPGHAGAVVRVPARELEASVYSCIADAFNDPLGLCALAALEVPLAEFAAIAGKAAEVVGLVRSGRLTQLKSLVEEVRLMPEQALVTCDVAVIADLLGLEPPASGQARVELLLEGRLKRSGGAIRLVQATGAAMSSTPSSSFITLVLKARRWWAALETGEMTAAMLARREGVTRSFLCRVVRLAFLAPALVDGILAGKLRAEVDRTMLLSVDKVGARWSEQAARYLPDAEANG